MEKSNDVLYEAQLENLSRDSKLQTEVSQWFSMSSYNSSAIHDLELNSSHGQIAAEHPITWEYLHISSSKTYHSLPQYFFIIL